MSQKNGKADKGKLLLMLRPFLTVSVGGVS